MDEGRTNMEKIKDRLRCAYCKNIETFIFCEGFNETFICKKCGKINYVKPQLKAYKRVEG
jgi:hypothetical protein